MGIGKSSAGQSKIQNPTTHTGCASVGVGKKKIERDQRIRKQRGLCKVCRKKFSKKRKPFVDHVHDRTKKVRGILCRYCNTLLGSSFDDIKILLSAVKYLKESKKENTCLE